jgi:hypothetical protein
LGLKSFVDFMVISSLIGLISKEIYLFIVFQEFKTISLVPSDWEHVKADLTSNRVFDSKIRELLFESINKLLSDEVFMVKLLEIISFSLRTISADWRNIDQSCSVFDESSSFDRNIDICDVVQAKADELFEFILAKEIFDALRGTLFTDFSRNSLPL